MELKEARYILAIARHQSIGKAAESLYISQPSLSKYLKNLEERLGAPLFSRHENRYYPTYMGERYLHYAEQIVACGDEWMQEYDDIAHRQRGRLNIAVPIMMGSTLIEPMLAPFHKRYPYVTLNIMEAVNFIAENSLETSSIDLTLYNIHEFPETMDYQILRSEEIVLVLHENHPLAAKAITRPSTRTRTPVASPWISFKSTTSIHRSLSTRETPPCRSIWLWTASALPSPRRAISTMKTSTPETAPSAFPSAINRPSQLPSPPIGKTGICRSMRGIFWK